MVLAAVDQDAILLHARNIFAMTLQAIVDSLIVGVRRILERDVKRFQLLDRVIDTGGTQCDVLDAFAAVEVEVFFDLRFVVGGFIDWDTNSAVWACHCARFQPRQLAFDVEIAHLTEIEELFIKSSPLIHIAAIDVMRHVIDLDKAHTIVP